MKKLFTLIVSCIISFNAVHAEITWTLSDDGTLTISGTDMPNYRDGSTWDDWGAPWYSQREAIKKVVIKNGVTSIGDYAFSGCSGLVSVTFGNSVTSIGYQAFSGCSSLNSVTIPNSVTNIERSAFSSCSGLTSVTIPNSVTSIAASVFAFCSALTSIIVDEGNATYDSRENCNAIIETKSNTLISGCKNTIIPNSVTSIGEDAFFGCSGLTSVTFGNSVTSIGYRAFSRCSDLTSVTFGSSVTSIGDYAFEKCFGLTSITSEAKTPPNCGRFCFGNVKNSIPVYVPANSVEKYIFQWYDFTNILAIPTMVLTDGETFNNDSQLTEREISYTRIFNNTSWQALYIPFSISYKDWKDDFDVAYINGIRQIDTNGDNVMDETIMDVFKIEEGSLIPNTPYLIRAKTIGEKAITVNDATLYSAEENSIDCSTTIAQYTFTGTYETIPASTLIENEYYAMGGGSVIMTDGESDLKPFRWYLKVEARSPIYNVANTSNAAKTITIRVIDEDGETTGISQILQNDKTLSRIYDINGRVVNENALKPGMYIKNGKKLVIK